MPVVWYGQVVNEYPDLTVVRGERENTGANIKEVFTSKSFCNYPYVYWYRGHKIKFSIHLQWMAKLYTLTATFPDLLSGH